MSKDIKQTLLERVEAVEEDLRQALPTPNPQDHE